MELKHWEVINSIVCLFEKKKNDAFKKKTFYSVPNLLAQTKAVSLFTVIL